jgi:hypothetical protein
LDDRSDSGLDGRAVFGEWEVEGRMAAKGFAWGRFSGGVVVVAEGLSAEADAAAAVAVGEDVTALVTWCRLLVVRCWLLVDCVHFGLSPHLGVFVQSIQK